MKKIIVGAALVFSLSACGGSNTVDPETLDVSGIVTEKEFESGSTSCAMSLFKAPGRPAPPAPAKTAPAKPAAPRPPAGNAPAKPASSAAKPAGGDVKPIKTYKSRSYVVYPIIGGSNRCYKADCWEIEFVTPDGQEFDVCVTKEVYDSYEIGETFPEEG